MDDLKDYRGPEEGGESEQPNVETPESVPNSKEGVLSGLHSARAKIGAVILAASAWMGGVAAEAQGPRKPDGAQVAANKGTDGLQLASSNPQYTYFIYWSKKEGSQMYIDWRGSDLPIENLTKTLRDNRLSTTGSFAEKALRAAGSSSVRIFQQGKDIYVVEKGTVTKFELRGKLRTQTEIPEKDLSTETNAINSLQPKEDKGPKEDNIVSPLASKKDKKIEEGYSVEKVGPYLWRIIPIESEKNGEGWRKASKQKPVSYEYEPDIFEQSAVFTPTQENVLKARREKKVTVPIEVHDLLPIIRDIGETKLHEANLNIELQGIDNPEIDIHIETSQPNNNKFCVVTIKGDADIRKNKKVSYRAIMGSDVTQGKTLPIKNQAFMSGISQAGTLTPAIEALNDSVNWVNKNIKFDPNPWNRGRDVKATLQSGLGDCGSQSMVVVARANHQDIKLVVGYDSNVNGFLHAWVQMPDNVKGDPVSGQIGSVEIGNIVTIVGNEFQFKDGSVFNGKIKNPPNNGLMLSENCEIDRTGISFSCPGKGAHGALLSQRKTNPPAHIIEANKEFAEERKVINDNQRIAKK